MRERVPLTSDEWERARRVLTSKQLRAVEGWARGFNLRELAWDLHVAETTAGDRLARALQLVGVEEREAKAKNAVVTRCGRCGGSWSGGLDEARQAFAEHACEQ